MNKNCFIFLHAFIHLLENGCTAKDSLELLISEKETNSISNTADKILSSLKKGNSIGTAFIHSSILPSPEYYPYILQFEKTGNLLSSLRLILEDIERKSTSRSQLIQSLMYPLCIIAITVAALGLLFVKGIPWMLNTGLITDTSIIPKMQFGTGLACILFVFLSSIAISVILFMFKKKQSEYSFWAMLVTLSDSGLTFNQSIDICTQTAGIPYTVKSNTDFFDSPEIGLFAHTSLLTAKLTGDYPNAFRSISKYKKEKLLTLYAVFSKIAEPILISLTGTLILVLAITVFLPIFNSTGVF